MKLAVICNWGDDCGIATYSGFLLGTMAARGDVELKVFSEVGGGTEAPFPVEECWERGKELRTLSRKVLEWGPNAVLIQHEYGIFPRAGHWIQLLQDLYHVPYAVTFHSVYRHRDKAVCTAAARSAIVHTGAGESCLRELGYNGKITVIPHGCVTFPDAAENWNIYRTDYAIVQFGFGFGYKGVETIFEAISTLKGRHPEKYKDIFFTYLCSENRHTRAVNDAYYKSLLGAAESFGVYENVGIVRGFQTPATLNEYLRTNRLAVFPYVSDPANVVYGASGAVRVAMANAVPVIASSSPMFADMEGVLPRPANAVEFADEIDRVFSDGAYRRGILERAADYVLKNTWERVAEAYISVLKSRDEPAIITNCR